MKTSLLVLAAASALGFATRASADTIISVTNGTGSYATTRLAFYDANGVYLVLDAAAGAVTLTYPDQVTLTFPYAQTIAGLTVTGTWSGTDEWGYAYSATAAEDLVQTRHSGSGRGGGYRTVITTSLAGGTTTYDYPGAYAPPLVAPAVTASTTQTTATLSWNSAAGGVPPYSYAVFDQNGVNVANTVDLTATVPGLGSSTAYTFTVVATDAAGHTASAPALTVYTLNPTLNTVFTYNPVDNTVTATWTADPTAVSYAVFYYDWTLGVWVDGADTTGTTAVVSGWSPNVYIPMYIAAYDVNGVETDYDQQLVSVQPPAPPPPPTDDGGG